MPPGPPSDLLLSTCHELNRALQNDMLKSQPAVVHNVTLFGIKVFAGQTGAEWAPHPVGQEEDAQKDREGRHVKTDTREDAM